MKPALLLLDPQNDFFGEDNPNLVEFRATIPVINAAIDHSRIRNWPVIFVQHVSQNKPSGSRAWSIHEGFDHMEKDFLLSKTQMNAFWNTELDPLLKLCHVDFVVVAGYIA